MANFLPAFPIDLVRARSERKFFKAFSMDVESFGGTSIPVSKGIIASRQPGWSVVIIAQPLDAASIKTLGIPSP